MHLTEKLLSLHMEEVGSSIHTALIGLGLWPLALARGPRYQGVQVSSSGQVVRWSRCTADQERERERVCTCGCSHAYVRVSSGRVYQQYGSFERGQVIGGGRGLTGLWDPTSRPTFFLFSVVCGVSACAAA